MNVLIKRCRPTVERHWRMLLAGSVWLMVGLALVLTACRWLAQLDWPVNLVLAATSAGLGLAVFHFGFSRIAARNIERLRKQDEPACLFSFQGWRSYILILVMMLFGYALRHLPIPKSVDAAIYFIIGSALAFSSTLYMQAFVHE
ncbi:MAG: hypothetical protein ABFD97_12435 [Syntrophobacter sp.]